MHHPDMEYYLAHSHMLDDQHCVEDSNYRHMAHVTDAVHHPSALPHDHPCTVNAANSHRPTVPSKHWKGVSDRDKETWDKISGKRTLLWAMTNHKNDMDLSKNGKQTPPARAQPATGRKAHVHQVSETGDHAPDSEDALKDQVVNDILLAHATNTKVSVKDAAHGDIRKILSSEAQKPHQDS